MTGREGSQGRDSFGKIRVTAELSLLWRDDGQAAMPLAVRVTPSEFVSGDKLLVLEIPGSLMKQSTRILHDFGQYAFLISQAISIDLFVCCSTFTNYGYDVYKLMLEYISSVFSLDITFLHIANSFVLDNPGQKPSLTFKTIDSVTKKISHLRAGLDSDEVMIGNLQNSVDFNACINSILRAFTNESAV